jgi:hypothetical protein
MAKVAGPMQDPKMIARAVASKLTLLSRHELPIPWSCMVRQGLPACLSMCIQGLPGILVNARPPRKVSAHRHHDWPRHFARIGLMNPGGSSRESRAVKSHRNQGKFKIVFAILYICSIAASRAWIDPGQGWAGTAGSDHQFILCRQSLQLGIAQRWPVSSLL